MLDLRFVRENIAAVQQAATAKGEKVSLDEFVTLDEKRRNLLREVEQLKYQRNTVSREIGLRKKKGEDAAVLIFVYTFHLLSQWKRGEPFFTSGRYAGSNPYFKLLRLSHIFIHFDILLLIGSGIIKVIKNLPAVELAYPILVTTTTLHNLATVLLLVSFTVFFSARYLYNKKGPTAAGTEKAEKLLQPEGRGQ